MPYLTGGSPTEGGIRPLRESTYLCVLSAAKVRTSAYFRGTGSGGRRSQHAQGTGHDLHVDRCASDPLAVAVDDDALARDPHVLGALDAHLGMLHVLALEHARKDPH